MLIYLIENGLMNGLKDEVTTCENSGIVFYKDTT